MIELMLTDLWCGSFVLILRCYVRCYSRKRGAKAPLRYSCVAGQRALQVLKDVTGISGFKAKKRRERQWKEFRDDFRKKRQKDVE